ncbi:EAL domain, c-di-GMP-specific phosphodiesterase class I (or its enzymatically inactive variant) [Tropicibacter naphthalenivorans]|uniref:Putative membrane protein YjcC n=2 Tax=Tropicibacter naphthalenivorans TaxID=441103 RepID=A0A0P1GH29_9RHOB|nr:EAL domain-containing protein [Tropicibacter naphthalenivorans]CUH80931.1 putative membrane protein YjcC [Tropicibacter naphthalenivorans]SMC91243.1 EAL domain, c-di-GMP-specific phosphodiesterase class I (or its enzymatically inactive variant) [Tropicibacter naphthalenivorans]
MTDARTEPSVADNPETLDLPIGAHVSFPIILSTGVTWGMLCAFSRQPRQDLTDRDVAMFGIYADMLSRDIEVQVIEGGSAEELELRIDKLIRTDLDIHLQPILSLPGAIPQGYEALTRFPAELGSVETIFRRAKYDDRIVTLEEAVARKTAAIPMQMGDGFFVSVNASVTSIETLDFESIFPPHVRHRIVLEITEHERVPDYAAFLSVLTRLRAQGFRIAIDDVGAGYSSLRHVIQLKPDFLKLDRSLVIGLLASREQRGLVKALAEMVQSHGGVVIAEGVENPKKVVMLERLGVTMAQGYLFARPMPAAKVLAADG